MNAFEIEKFTQLLVGLKNVIEPPAVQVGEQFARDIRLVVFVAPCASKSAADNRERGKHQEMIIDNRSKPTIQQFTKGFKNEK